MKGIKKKMIACILLATMLTGSLAALSPLVASAAGGTRDPIKKNTIPLQLRYTSPASHGVGTAFETISTAEGSNGPGKIQGNVNDDWERWSLPLGNGYFGVNVFGRTDTERLTIADKTLANYYGSWYNSLGGLNTFSETYIDFGHNESSVSGYERVLDLRTALSTVSYTYGGVKYTREYFTSYPDKALVIRLTASENGKLSFTLRPTIPYEQDKAYDETFTKNLKNNNAAKSGTVTATVSDGVGRIELAGTMENYGVDFVGLYRVYTDGSGTVTAGTVKNSHKNSDGITVADNDGVIRVEGARDAYIVLTLGTDYELSPDVFTTDTAHKPTHKTTLNDARRKVNDYLSAVTERTAGKSYADGYKALRTAHLTDYQKLFGRVSLNLNCSVAEMAKTTDRLLADYKAGKGGTYLEVLYFQYGRYLLIASSRKGALPAHLQGAWNRYNYSPWSSGYWHNINVQMNYWPAFSTNLAETFESYVDYNAAYMKAAKANADALIRQNNPGEYGKDGGNGWVIDTGGYPYAVGANRSAGNLGFTTQLFWEYYAYTQDKELLKNVVYPVLADAARYITKCVKEDESGHFLVEHCDSPEQFKDGVWYWTSGTTYAQTFAYLNNYHTLLAAREAGIDISGAGDGILATVMAQLDKYDPIIVGLSGQIKEFREEEYYGDIGEYAHRHISQLVGLYPGDLINGTTPAWLDAAKYVLTERGDEATGWGVAHRLNLWARTKDGNRTYKLLEQLLKNNTATNLWDLHPPFQIDGNFGGTAGISEMLLQSHEGYIEPLAAIPDAWTTGSYTGLVARGNFTVSAAWKDGVMTALDITSGVGGTCRVKANGLRGVAVTTASGKTVRSTVENGILSFETVAGETYLLSCFTSAVRTSAVADLAATYTANGPVHLAWSPVAGAVSYNVYKAIGSAPDYTLVTSTRGTAYTCRRAPAETADRATYAVTAVSADGTESDRALAYTLPADTEANIEKTAVCVTPVGLQVTVKANASSVKYRLYSRTSDAAPWTLVGESNYPVLFDNQYDSKKTYGVSVVSFFDGGESEIVRATGDITASDADRTELLSAYASVSVSEEGLTTRECMEYEHKMGIFLSYLTNMEADAETIRAYLAEIKAYVAPTPTYDGTAKTVTVSLDGNIRMNLYYSLDTDLLTSYPDAGVEFTLADGKTVTVYATDAKKMSDGTYRFSLPLAAKQMTDEISARFVYGGGYGEKTTMSVREYCDRILADETQEKEHPGVHALVRSMLNYGSYVQRYFGYNTENLAGAGVFTDATDPVRNTAITCDEKPVITGNVSGLAFVGYTLALESETAIRVAVRTEDVTAYTFSVTSFDGKETMVVPEARGEFYVIAFSGAVAQDLSARCTLKVTAKDGQTATLSISALCYAGSVLDPVNDNEPLKNVVRALKLYGDAAKAYK